MAIAQAIEAGRRSAESWGAPAGQLVDPGQLLTSITQAIAQGRTSRPGSDRISNLSPKKIHAAAASAAVAQEQLEAIREKNRMDREKWEWEKENMRRARIRQGEEDERKWQENWQKEMTAIGTRYDVAQKRAQETRTVEQKEFRDQRQDDYYQMLNSLANNRPEGIISFFRKYGAPDQNIQDIQFAPPTLASGQPNPDAGKVMVTYGDGQNEMWQDKDQLVQGLIGWANPDVQTKIADLSLKKREQTRKEEETKIKSKELELKGQEESRQAKKLAWEMGGGIDPKTMQKYRADGLEFYQKLVENADIDPKEVPFETWFPQYVKTITGGVGQAGVGGVATPTGAMTQPPPGATQKEMQKQGVGIVRGAAPTWAPPAPSPGAKWSPKVEIRGMKDKAGNAQKGGWVIQNAQGQWVVAPNQGAAAEQPAVRKKPTPEEKPAPKGEPLTQQEKNLQKVEQATRRAAAEEREAMTPAEQAEADLAKKREQTALQRKEGTGTMTYRKVNKAGEAIIVTKDETGKQISAIPEREATKTMREAAATPQAQEVAKTAETQQKLVSPVKTRTERAEATAAQPREGEPQAKAPEPTTKEASPEAKVPKEGGAEKAVAKAESGAKGGEGGKGEGGKSQKAINKAKNKKKKKKGSK